MRAINVAADYARALSTAAAGGLPEPVAAGGHAGPDEAERRPRDQPDGERPVVEGGSGHPIGVVRARRG